MIDQAGIKSLEKGADNIRLTGNEGESSPAQKMIKAGIPKDMTMDQAFDVFIKSEGRTPKNIPELLEFFKNRTLSEGFPIEEYQMEFEKVFPDMIPLRGTDEYNDALEDYFRGLAKGPVLPSDEDPVNPFGPKPIGPVLPDRQMAAFGGIMGLDQRKQYGIGSEFKRAFRKVTKPFTKIAQKLMPKELAGVAQIAAPFLGPVYGPLAMAAGQAKQRGQINPLSLLLAAAPYAKFRGGTGARQFIPTGYGDMGSGQSLRNLFLRGEDPMGAKGTLFSDEFAAPYEKEKGLNPIFGKYGKSADEFLFGTPRNVEYIETQGPQLPPDLVGTVDPGIATESIQQGLGGRNIATEATSGLIGKGGEAFQAFGGSGDVGIADTIIGKKAFFDAKGKPSILKLGSWGIGIASNIRAKKYKDEMEAMNAAEDALLAENAAASEAEIQAARDWAAETFGRLTMADFAVGGRVGLEFGGLGALGLDDMQKEPETFSLDGSGMKILMPDSNPTIIGEGIQGGEKVFFIDINGSTQVISEDEFNAIFGKLKAKGGRINKAMGGLSSLQTQPSDVTPPGMELDLRGGGFIPIGKAEKADDVPARVSKNEFVFTADAVKAAGGGSVNEGAKKMYDTMKRLESQVA
jgi:hypothetical protein